MLKRRSFFKEHIEANAFKYICGLVLFVAGLFMGVSVMAGIGVDKEQELVAYFTSAAKSAHGTFNESFKACLITNFKYIAIYFVLSLTAYTAWLSMAVSGIKGFVAGFTAAFLIRNYGTHGVIYTVLSIAPAGLIMLPVLMFASAVCINFAIDRRKSKEAGIRSAMKILPALAVIYSIMAICSLYDAIVATVIFKNLF